MYISVVSNNHFQIITNLFASVNSSIKIISPFLGKEMTDLLCKTKLLNQSIQVDVITRFYDSDFYKGVSCIEGLRDLKNANIGLYALKKLHTKLYIFDDTSAIVGSANFTSGGFHYNNELSLFIQEDPQLVRELIEFFQNLYRITNPSFEILASRIDEMIDKVKNKVQNEKPFEEPYEPTEKWGAEPPSTVKVHSSPISTSAQNTAPQSLMPLSHSINRIWLKFEESADSRSKPSERYKPTIWQGQMITAFPFKKGMPSIRLGEQFYMAVVSIDERGKPTQHIVGCGIFDSTAQEADQTMKLEYPWMDKYSYYCKVRDFKHIDTTIGNGILVKAMIDDLGRYFYAATQDSGKNPYVVHHQKSHLRLTEIAKANIDSKLDLIFEYCGKLPNN